MHGWKATVVWMLVPERVTWRLTSPGGEVRYLKVSPAGDEHTLAAERDRMTWAGPRLPVPRVLDHGTDGTHQWLLTDGMDGRSAVEDDLCADPRRLVPLLGQGLRRFHSIAWKDCPFNGRLDSVLPVIRQRLSDGTSDPDWVFKRHGNITAHAALDQLEQHPPSHEDLVVCHGDYCVPNVLIQDWRLAGFVDLGAVAVADRWRDIAVALWSVTRNMGPGWEEQFLDAYGIKPNPEKAAYYLLLYDMLP